MMDSPIVFPALKSDFSDAASESVSNSKPKKKSTIRLSVRVTQEEKDQLTQAASAVALSAYVRQKLFGHDIFERPKRYQKKQSEPSLDAKELARLLGMFGQSELTTSILALSLAAAQGHVDIDDAMEEKIEAACDDIHTIKLALIMALGVKPQSFDA